MPQLAIEAAKQRVSMSASAGRAPPNPDLAAWLLEQGIESMSLNPDTVVDTWLALAAGEAVATS